MQFDESGWLFPRSSLEIEAVYEISEADILSLFVLCKEEQAWQRGIQENVDRHYRDGVLSMDFLQSCVLMQNAKGALQTYPLGDYLNFGTTRHFYRGENQLFPTSAPTLNRDLDGLSPREQEIIRAVSNLRIGQFAEFIFQFHIVPYWMAKVSDVNFEAIAQHYGFRTHLLDLTNDVLTALFFATCYYDKTERQYKPLTNERIHASYESQFGVIFHAPYWLVDWNSSSCYNNWFFKMEEKLNNRALGANIDSGDFDGYAFQTGFQPLMRCHYQSGYVFPMRTKDSLQNDFRFERLVFRQSEKLSNLVYEKMDRGKKVFPQEGISFVEDVIEEIRNSLKFTTAEIKTVYDSKMDHSIFKDFQTFLKALSETVLFEQPIRTSEDRVEFRLDAAESSMVNEQYDNIDIGEIIGGPVFTQPEQRKRRKEAEIRIYGKEIE